ncbi:protein Nam8p [Monosporozyma unispora]|nr:hypothetical protein C6P44_004566 [Kazachstania unispora]
MSYSYQNKNNHYLRKQSQNSSSSPYNNRQNYNYSNRSVQSRYGNDNEGGNTLYMGGLDFHWNENVIKTIWSEIGITNINVKIMWQLQSNNQLNQGYCFIEFPTHQDATQALLNNGSMIPGFPNKYFKLNWSENGKDNNNMNNNLQKNDTVSIFVGDLASNVTETQLCDLFSHRYKSTLNAKIMIDLNTGLSKGYGFVNFSSLIDQQNALLEMQGVFLNGRAIKLGPSNKSTTSQDPLKKSSSSTTNHNNNTSSSSSVQLPKSQFMSPMQFSPQMNHFTDPNNTTVFIGGLSPYATEDELRNIFEPFGSIIYINIPMGKGCGFIQFVDRSSGELAIANMQGFPIGNSRIRLSWGRSAKQYPSTTTSSGTSPPIAQNKNYMGQLPISSPIYSNQFYTTTTTTTHNNLPNLGTAVSTSSSSSLEYLPGFQDNYFNTNSNNNTSTGGLYSFERLETRSNMYL